MNSSTHFSGSSRAITLVLAGALFGHAQQPPPSQAPPAPSEADTERWNLYFQATSIGQHHGRFRSPYQGDRSLLPDPEDRVSLTSTLFLGLRLTPNTQLYFDPELAGGRGFSNVNGLANFTNGELPRVATAAPKPYIARLYVSHDFGFGSQKEHISGDANQLAGYRPMTRYTVVVGRFTVTDFFDNNRYTHDPRTQFMGWATMYNGAWDYPADVRGYTWGWVHEFHARSWSLRYGSAGEPRVANGARFDRRIFRNRGDLFEGELRYKLGEHPGAVRLLGSLLHTNSGTYREANRLAEQSGSTPDVTATRHNGNLKYGSGLSAEQEIANDLGVFLRLGWNDGKTESFAFTAIDRLVSSGVSITGSRWRRKHDSAGTALTVSGISGDHAAYLARGGLDFLIGDGRLNYGTERVWESYYSARVVPGFFTSFDLQRITNPAYNRDRGPVWAASIRLHIEFDADALVKRRIR